jgi:hypothetical protein
MNIVFNNWADSLAGSALVLVYCNTPPAKRNKERPQKRSPPLFLTRALVVTSALFYFNMTYT